MQVGVEVVVGEVTVIGTRSVPWRVPGVRRALDADAEPARTRDSSVTVTPDWNLLEEIEFTRLLKLNLNVDAPEDL